MYQGIETKYHPPTNFRGQRVSAVTAAGTRLMRAWDPALNHQENHKEVARELAEMLRWDGQWYGGSTYDDGYFFVLVVVPGAPDFTVHPLPREE